LNLEGTVTFLWRLVELSACDLLSTRSSLPYTSHYHTSFPRKPSTMAEPSNGAAAPETSAPIPEDNSAAQESTALETTSPKPNTPHSNRTGWDGKLRVNGEKQAVLANPEALEDSDYEDEDAPPVDQIAADEGMWE
jgi:hypothetical protein